ncbi:hypothetical protein MTO96_011269 [Rhipicephalus appendiculatus]
MGPTKPTQRPLIGPGQTAIATVGYTDATVTWRNTEIQETVFIIKRLKEALLSRPAIEALGILQRSLELAETCTQATDVPDISASYPKLTSGLRFMKTECSIKVKNDAKPYAVTYPRRVPLPLLPLVKKELKRMDDMGVVQKIEHATEWCFPMVIARKKNNELRICVDYGQLNQQILRERVLMPRVDECLAKLAGATVFSRLDARAGYWQVPLAKDSREYTTFITPFGRFQFLRLPFGISPAPEFYQREMLHVLEGLDGVSCLQDIIVSGKTTEEHDTNLRLVLRKLQDAEYDYTMSHTPGNKLYTADLLSRKPSKEPADERTLEAAVHEYEELVLEQLPASNHLLNRIRTSIQSDKTLSKVATFCTTS